MVDRRRCQSCGHECVVGITAKCADRFGIRWPGGREQIGYVPPHELVGLRERDASSDYVNISYCLVCGQIQGEWPVKGAASYLKKYARERIWAVTMIFGGDIDHGRWERMFLQSKTAGAAEAWVRERYPKVEVVVREATNEEIEAADIRES